jgi:hypothetical protein
MKKIWKLGEYYALSGRRIIHYINHYELTESLCRINITTCLDGGYDAQYGFGEYRNDLRLAAEETSNPPLVGLFEVGFLELKAFLL